jgi:hypothetical protein
MITEVMTGAAAVRSYGADRFVSRSSDEGDYFENFLIRSRERVLNRFRQLRSWGYPMQQAYHIAMLEGLEPQHYGGPGRQYVRQGHIHTINRRWVVLRQTGGLDI